MTFSVIARDPERSLFGVAISTAVLLVPTSDLAELWRGVDIRVDQHPEPVAELRRIFDIMRERWREARAELERQNSAG